VIAIEMTKSSIRNLTLAVFSLVCLLAVCFVQPASTLAQDTGSGDADGEICVRAFQDINGNGIRDLNDPPLQGGISANLLNEQGIIIASALLDNSPTVTRGLICFQFLPAGQYTVEVISANYRATTPNTLTSIVQGSGSEVPYVMDFGGHDLALASQNSTVPPEQQDAGTVLTRVLVALLGAFAALIVMTVIGFIIYLVRYRGRLRRAEAEAVDYRRPTTSTRTTGSIPVVTVSPPVDPTDTSEFRPKP
jgi:hypothetical protein